MEILKVEYETKNNEIIIDDCENTSNLTIIQLETLFDQAIETIKLTGSHA